MPLADVNGQRLYFEDSGGDGPPVLFSHGFLMDHEMWAPQVEALGRRYRCITWDERGHGGTPATGSFTYWDSAADGAALLDHLGIRSAVWVGMSQGGFLAQRAAVQSPDRVRALVMVDSAASTEDPDTVEPYNALHAEWMANGPAAVRETVASIILGADVDWGPWFAKWDAWPRDWMRHTFECLMGREDLHARLREITCPSLVIHGTADAAIPMERAEDLCSGLSACQGVVRVVGAPHASNLSHPGEVNAALAGFLDGLAAA
jgi:3-oxoadipate enol-lactonase